MQVSELTQSEVTKALKSSLDALSAIGTAEELRQSKAQLVGDAAPLTKLNALIKSLPGDKKAEAGKMMGEAKAELMAAFEAKAAELEKIARAQRLEAEKVDITGAANYIQRGARHPLSLLMDQISDVFVGMGWIAPAASVTVWAKVKAEICHKSAEIRRVRKNKPKTKRM